MAKQKLIVANWKMNPSSARAAISLAHAEDSKNVVICPPFPFLLAVGKTLKNASLGAQDLFWEEEGPYTGEVSAEMLRKIGVKYVIVGHSERRRFLEETDEMIAKKVGKALKARMNVILCVGEPASVRRKGIKSAIAFVRHQLALDTQGIRGPHFSFLTPPTGGSHLVIAYEPLWAIGSGNSAIPQDAAQMAIVIKNHLAPRTLHLAPAVLYGGSVTPKTIRGFLAREEIDGALVGGASLEPSSFKHIIRSNI